MITSVLCVCMSREERERILYLVISFLERPENLQESIVKLQGMAGLNAVWSWLMRLRCEQVREGSLTINITFVRIFNTLYTHEFFIFLPWVLPEGGLSSISLWPDLSVQPFVSFLQQQLQDQTTRTSARSLVPKTAWTNTRVYPASSAFLPWRADEASRRKLGWRGS